jgi:hypothetical protein
VQSSFGKVVLVHKVIKNPLHTFVFRGFLIALRAKGQSQNLNILIGIALLGSRFLFSVTVCRNMLFPNR